jgi:hypothetical protein
MKVAMYYLVPMVIIFGGTVLEIDSKYANTEFKQQGTIADLKQEVLDLEQKHEQCIIERKACNIFTATQQTLCKK